MRTKISYKLIAAVGFVTIVIIGIFAYVILNAHQQQLVAELERNAHQLSETVKSSTKYDMLLNQRESVHRIINTIGAQEGIEKVRIFNKDGAIIFSNDSLDIGQMVDKKPKPAMPAIDAMAEKGGTLTLSTSLAHMNGQVGARDCIQIQVSDTGSGIPREHLEKIFEPFFTTKRQKGNGLGLAIVWGIIEKHNGRIIVESEAGKGTTFKILLPVEEKL